MVPGDSSGIPLDRGFQRIEWVPMEKVWTPDPGLRNPTKMYCIIKNVLFVKIKVKRVDQIIFVSH